MAVPGGHQFRTGAEPVRRPGLSVLRHEPGLHGDRCGLPDACGDVRPQLPLLIRGARIEDKGSRFFFCASVLEPRSCPQACVRTWIETPFITSFTCSRYSRKWGWAR